MRTTQRLDKLLSNFGYGTRKEIKHIVKEGAVKIDGTSVKDGSLHVDPEKCVITIHNKVLNYRRFIYVMMNKPAGYISATYDNAKPTVIDILPEEFKRFKLFPAGRLDIDTEGLLILTNDGQLAHNILAPRKHVPKRYYAHIEGNVTEEDIESFRNGITLDDGYKTLPAVLEIFRSGTFSEVEVVIHEGKYHQVKRMFEAVGKQVRFLKRIQMGSLKLDESLAPGECRELSDLEVESLLL